MFLFLFIQIILIALDHKHLNCIEYGTHDEIRKFASIDGTHGWQNGTHFLFEIFSLFLFFQLKNKKQIATVHMYTNQCEQPYQSLLQTFKSRNLNVII